MSKSCGTYSGYTIHIRDKTTPCDECRRASRIYQKHKRNEKVSRLGYDPRRFSRHHIDFDQYSLLLEKYDGKCWVCKNLEARNIDHDHNCCPRSHSCGKCIRGIICNNCNTALGLFKDNTNILQDAIDYLKSFN